jgi:hypothetical protein
MADMTTANAARLNNGLNALISPSIGMGLIFHGVMEAIQTYLPSGTH